MVETFQRHERLLGDCLEKLKRSSVMVAGVGGLGSTVSTLLVRTGVGRLFLIDFKEVDEPDLNRQILYDFDSIGKGKLSAARERLKRMNPDVDVVTIESRIDADFEIPDVDLVVDCLDNFRSRFVLEEKVWRRGIPMVHGGVRGYSGQITTLKPHSTPTLKDIFGEVEDDPFPPQVYPPIVTLIGSIQASEAVKILCGDEDGSLINRLLIIDLSINSYDLVYLSPSPQE